jgi:hypothetical protein
LLYLPLRTDPAAVIGKGLRLRPRLAETVHFPRPAKKTTRSALFRAPTFVMSHASPSGETFTFDEKSPRNSLTGGQLGFKGTLFTKTTHS